MSNILPEADNSEKKALKRKNSLEFLSDDFEKPSSPYKLS
jgi:hypothetical protein